jgi:hypothetical protein
MYTNMRDARPRVSDNSVMQAEGVFSTSWGDFVRSRRMNTTFGVWQVQRNCKVSYLVFMLKLSTHRMHDLRLIVPHIRSKVFTDNQMSWIKYNYYINNVSKDYDDPQVKWNSRRLHNSIGTATGVTRSLELIVEEFQSIFSIWVVGLSSGGK